MTEGYFLGKFKKVYMGVENILNANGESGSKALDVIAQIFVRKSSGREWGKIPVKR